MGLGIQWSAKKENFQGVLLLHLALYLPETLPGASLHCTTLTNFGISGL
jgi:hypothetical protein